MGRKPKYPDADKIIRDFFIAVSESYNSPSSTESVEGHKKQDILAEEFDISRLKVRKILITTGDLVCSETVEIQQLMAEGFSLPAIGKMLGMQRSTLNAYLPYNRGVYKLAAVSAAADRTALYRARKQAVSEFKADPSSFNLWKAIALFTNYPFATSGRGSRPGVKFKYIVSPEGSGTGHHYNGEEVPGYGNELFIIDYCGTQREKSISRSSVDYAYGIVRKKGIQVSGPIELKIFGSSYVYAIFVRLGVITVD